MGPSPLPRIFTVTDSIGNSLPRHLRVTLPVVPSNSQLLDTTALPLGMIIQPFAQLRYDEAPIALVSNWISGQSAFDQPQPRTEGETGDDGPPRCEKCRGYINPYVRWTDGGRRWGCNLCGQGNEGKLNLPHIRWDQLIKCSSRYLLLLALTIWTSAGPLRPPRTPARYSRFPCSQGLLGASTISRLGSGQLRFRRWTKPLFSR